MENQTIIWATVIIAVIAVLGRIVINRQKKGSINWFKLLLLGVAVLACLLGYLFVEPQRIADSLSGEATLAESHSHNIAGRQPGADIPCFGVAYADNSSVYCVPVVDSLSRTEYYILKDAKMTDLVEREVEESVDNRQNIKRKTTTFEITKNPKNKADQYLPIYKVCLKSGGKILAAIDERDAQNPSMLPVARITASSDKLQDIAQRLDSTMISDSYLMLFNSQQYSSNQVNYLIWRAVAGVAFAIVSVLVLMAIKYFSKR